MHNPTDPHHVAQALDVANAMRCAPKALAPEAMSGLSPNQFFHTLGRVWKRTAHFHSPARAYSCASSG